MKFEALSSRFAIESTLLEKTIIDTGLKLSKEKNKLIDTDRLPKAISAAIEHINIAYSDLDNLCRVEKLKESSVISSAALEACTVTENIIYRKYDIATEGIGNAISAVFRFIRDAFKWVVDKISSFLGGSKDKVDSNIDKALSIVKNDLSGKDSKVSFSSDDERGKLYTSKGLLIVDGLKDVIPTGLTPNDLMVTVKSLSKRVDILSTILDTINKEASASMKLMESAMDGKVSVEEISKANTSFIDKFVNGLNTGFTKSKNNSDSTIYKLEDKVHTEKYIEVTGNTSVKLEIMDNPYAGKDGEDKIEITPKFTEALLIELRGSNINETAVGVKKKFEGIGNMFNDFIKKVERSKDIDPGVKNACASFSKDIKDTSFAIWYFVSSYVSFESKLSGRLLKATEIISKAKKESGTAVESFDLKLDVGAIAAQGDPDITYLSQALEEAASDYNTAVEAITSGKRTVYLDGRPMALESLYAALEAKYVMLYPSLEEEVSKPVEESKPAESTTAENTDSPTETKSEEEKDKPKEVNEGVLAKIKAFLKSILDFFTRVFKAIRDKIYMLFGGDNPTTKAIESKVESTVKKTEELSKQLKEKSVLEAKKEEISSNKSAYAEEVVTYYEKDEFEVEYSNPNYSIGEGGTIKDVTEAFSEVQDVMKAMSAFFNKAALETKAMIDGIESEFEKGSINMDTIKRVRSQMVREMRDAIIQVMPYSGQEGSDSDDLLVARLGKSELVVNRIDLGAIIGKRIIEFKLKPSKDFKESGVFKFKSGEAASLKPLAEQLKNDVEDISKYYEGNLAKMVSVQEHIVNYIKICLTDNSANEENLSFIRDVVLFSIQLTANIAYTVKHLQNFSKYLVTCVDDTISEELNLLKARKVIKETKEGDGSDKKDTKE